MLMGLYIALNMVSWTLMSQFMRCREQEVLEKIRKKEGNYQVALTNHNRQRDWSMGYGIMLGIVVYCATTSLAFSLLLTPWAMIYAYLVIEETLLEIW